MSMNFASKLAQSSKKAAAEAKKSQINKLLEDADDALYNDIDDDMYDNVDDTVNDSKHKIMSSAIRNTDD